MSRKLKCWYQPVVIWTWLEEGLQAGGNCLLTYSSPNVNESKASNEPISCVVWLMSLDEDNCFIDQERLSNRERHLAESWQDNHSYIPAEGEKGFDCKGMFPLLITF